MLKNYLIQTYILWVNCKTISGDPSPRPSYLADKYATSAVVPPLPISVSCFIVIYFILTDMKNK